VSQLVDLDDLTADDLAHLAAIKREQERRRAEERVSAATDVMFRPALGAYLRGGLSCHRVGVKSSQEDHVYTS
jgi:hypothetical protein